MYDELSSEGLIYYALCHFITLQTEDQNKMFSLVTTHGGSQRLVNTNPASTATAAQAGQIVNISQDYSEIQ